MARNPFGHVDLRVRSLEEALPIYETYGPDYYAVVFEDPCGNRLRSTTASWASSKLAA